MRSTFAVRSPRQQASDRAPPHYRRWLCDGYDVAAPQRRCTVGVNLAEGHAERLFHERHDLGGEALERADRAAPVDGADLHEAGQVRRPELADLGHQFFGNMVRVAEHEVIAEGLERRLVRQGRSLDEMTVEAGIAGPHLRDDA